MSNQNPSFIAPLIGWSVLAVVCCWPFIGPWGGLMVAFAIAGGYLAHRLGRAA